MGFCLEIRELVRRINDPNHFLQQRYFEDIPLKTPLVVRSGFKSQTSFGTGITIKICGDGCTFTSWRGNEDVDDNKKIIKQRAVDRGAKTATKDSILKCGAEIKAHLNVSSDFHLNLNITGDANDFLVKLNDMLDQTGFEVLFVLNEAENEYFYERFSWYLTMRTL